MPARTHSHAIAHPALLLESSTELGFRRKSEGHVQYWFAMVTVEHLQPPSTGNVFGWLYTTQLSDVS
jgi:hypothetical protein